MPSPHVFSLGKLVPQDNTSGGSRTQVSKKNFPILQGMALYKLVLKKGGIREPHWHPNADEMGYCIKGRALVTLYGNKDTKETFVVQNGDVFLIPSGFLHHIENLGDDECIMALKFSHQEPEDFGISASLGAFSDAVLGNTWNVNKEVFQALKRTTKPSLITMRTSPVEVSDDANYSSIYKFSLASSQPILTNDGGYAKMARQNTWPMAMDQALYYLHLTGGGMREPHWHPATLELGYIVHGRGRMTILNPDGNMDTYDINEGDVYFVPEAYPHHIENLQDDGLDILVFFDQGMPDDVGFSGSVKAFSNEVLGSAMNIDPDFFNKLTKYYKDLFIVKRINPRD